MADAADIAQEQIEREAAANRPAPFKLDFTQGNCMDCGEHSTLVESVCGPCRQDAERRAHNLLSHGVRS